MEGTPSGISYDLVKKDLLKIHGVSNVHDLQMWSITVDKLAAMVHLQVAKGVVFIYTPKLFKSTEVLICLAKIT